MHGDLQHHITDLENVLRTTVDHSNTQLMGMAQCMGEWKQMVSVGGGRKRWEGERGVERVCKMGYTCSHVEMV